MEAVEVLVKEYETLRRESLDSITHRTQVASFGLAAIGALLAGPILAVEEVRSSWFVHSVLAIAIPFVSVLVLRMWLGELERMERAGSYLCWLEHRINSCMGAHLLTWESWLNAGPRLGYAYRAVIYLFLLVGLGAPIAGAFAVRPPLWGWLIALPGVALTVLATANAGLRLSRAQSRKDLAPVASWFAGFRQARPLDERESACED